VTGVQTCALPIYRLRFVDVGELDTCMPTATDAMAPLRQAGDAPLDDPRRKALAAMFRQPQHDLPRALQRAVVPVYARSGGHPTLLPIPEAVRVVEPPASVFTEPYPGWAAEVALGPHDLVVPLGPDVECGDALSLLLGVLIEQNPHVNGHRVTASPKPRYSGEEEGHLRRFDVQTEGWAVVRVAPRDYVLGAEVASRLKMAHPFQDEALEPHGDWLSWGPVIFAGPWRPERHYGWGAWRHPYQYPPPPRVDLRGAAYVMNTLRQHFPDIDPDFITDDEVPPEDRARGYPGEYLDWVAKKLVPEPNWYRAFVDNQPKPEP
jgi:hypothetical protein